MMNSPRITIRGADITHRVHMKKLYKYYSSTFNLEKYLNSPTIRLSQLNALNDPFEGFITQDVLNELANKFHTTLSSNKEMTRSEIRESKQHVLRLINSVGITSLSETSRNLLMWSHYASEHKGVCIGYKLPLIHPHKNKSIEPPEFKKVNYDSQLFDHEHINLLNRKDIDTNEIFSQIAERILTTKSDGWTYEKEYRYITEIEQCDTIRYIKSRATTPQYIKAAIKKAIEDDSHNIEEEETHIDLISKRTLKQLRQALNQSYSVEMKMKLSKDTMFLKNISINDIDSIYFGANHSIREINKIVDNIESNERFKNINIFHYELSKERYELVPYDLRTSI